MPDLVLHTHLLLQRPRNHFTKETQVPSFNDYELSPPLANAISDLKWETPSPIQSQALPILLGEPTDFLGLAATGTGKTAAFSIPLLEKIDASIPKVQSLILCPTRELALQVTEQINLLGKNKGIRALPVYGGANYSDQIRGLRSGVKVVVGTPGRVIDHLTKGTLSLDDVKTLILDEADEMISMGFKEELEKILAGIPRQTSNIWFFSATMSREVRRVADEYLRSPKQVQVNKTEMLPSTVEQLFYRVKESNKPEVLCKIIEAAEDFYGLVFCQTKSLVSDLTVYLNEKGYKVDCLHGDKDQKSRERTMQSFRDRKVTVLVCTDVASRGLDVKDITHVINYSLPRELDSYVHRIGRTARSGKTGFAMSLVTPTHQYLLGHIERLTRSKILEGKLPTRRDIATKKIGKVFTTFSEQTSFARAMDLLDDSWKQSLQTLTPQEVAGRFLSMMFPDAFTDQRMEALERPLRDPEQRREERPARERPRSSASYTPRESSKNSDDYSYKKSQSKGRFKSRSSDRFDSKSSGRKSRPSRSY